MVIFCRDDHLDLVSAEGLRFLPGQDAPGVRRGRRRAHAAGRAGRRHTHRRPDHPPAQAPDRVSALAPMNSAPETSPLDPTVRFSVRAQAYASGRPGYPPQIAGFLARELQLPAGRTIVDLGSGTGLSSLIFLQAGFEVIGVEPNGQMRAQAERDLA